MQHRQFVTHNMATRGKQGNEQVLARRIALLDRLPIARQLDDGMSITALTGFLNGAGYPCDRRTIERDLAAIVKQGSEWRQIGVHITCADSPIDARCKLYSHEPDSKAIVFTVLPPEEAMLLGLLEQEMKAFLPGSSHAVLARLSALSARVLAKPGNQQLAGFRERVRSVPEGPLERGPAIDADHLKTVAEALLHGVQIDVLYWPAKDKVEKQYRLHPVGLVKQGLFFWLLAVKEENAHRVELEKSVQSFRIDRMRSASLREQEVVVKALPTLAAALEAGALKFFSDGMVRLRLQFADCPAGHELCNNFRDTPLGSDQTITIVPGGVTELVATVRDSLKLVWMLQGQASLVRVIEPVSIRDAVVRFVFAASALYAS